jgi:uncharacterized protein DUF4395
MRKSRDFFICQQGFAVPNANPHLYSALMLQPRIIGGLVVLGSMLQSHELFLLLSAVLAWGTIVLKQNLFDAIYNYAVAFPRGLPPLGAAPAPRRFAQGSAAVLAFVIGTALLTGATMMAWILEGVFVAAVASVVLRRFCLPAHLYHELRRRLSPMSTLTAGSVSQRC